jgi:hypothetical protein
VRRDDLDFVEVKEGATTSRSTGFGASTRVDKLERCDLTPIK